MKRDKHTSHNAPTTKGQTEERTSGAAGGLPTDAADVSDQQEETHLKLKKLRFEATAGARLEIFKSIGSVIAALGVIGTLFVAIYQQREARISRDDDRFDRSVARVGSSNTSERLTGLAGLQQFLISDDADRQKAALLYLVNATAIETDPALR